MNRFGKVAGLVALFVAAFIVLAAPLKAGIVTFHFAPVGTSFSGFLAPDSPLIGKEVVSSRIYLNVESFPGSDAANFFTDISFPISPFPGNENVLSLLGSDLDWSGAGEFRFFQQTTLFNGTFVAARFAGETPGENFDGRLLNGSRIEFDVLPVPDRSGISIDLCAGAALIAFGFLVRRRPMRLDLAGAKKVSQNSRRPLV